jgi:hypothetical protein
MHMIFFASSDAKKTETSGDLEHASGNSSSGNNSSGNVDPAYYDDKQAVAVSHPARNHPQNSTKLHFRLNSKFYKDIR